MAETKDPSSNAKASQDEAANAKPSPAEGRDLLTERILVIALGLTVLQTGLNLTFLQYLGKPTPPDLAHLGSVALGALTMMLSRSRR